MAANPHDAGAWLDRVLGAAAALLLDWLNQHLSTGPALSRQAERVLRRVLKPLSPAVCAEAEQAIEAALSDQGVAAGG